VSGANGTSEVQIPASEAQTTTPPPQSPDATSTSPDPGTSKLPSTVRCGYGISILARSNRSVTPLTNSPRIPRKSDSPGSRIQIRLWRPNDASLTSVNFTRGRGRQGVPRLRGPR